MSQAVAKIVRLERRVMWRKRLMSLQDGLALVVMISSLIAAALVGLVRLRQITMPPWPAVIAAMSVSLAAVLTRWFFVRAREVDAAFLIDESLELDDRVATSCLIIKRGGPRVAFEEALIEDAAGRLVNQRAASVVPFRTRRWHTLSLVSVIALGAALMIPARPLPVNEAVAAERADIESAAEHLEQRSTEVEQAVPIGTETATLATEQAEVGRGFRRSTATRAEALRMLSALEERIRQRHDDLASTRAEEIVSMSDRRLGTALSTISTSRRRKAEPDESQLGLPADKRSGTSNGGAAKEPRVTTPSGVSKPLDSSQKDAGKSEATGSRAQSSAKSEQPNSDMAKAEGPRKAESQNRQQEPVPGQGNRNAGSAATDSTNPGSKIASEGASKPDALADQKPGDQKPGNPKGGGEKTADQNTGAQKPIEQPATEVPVGSMDALKAVPDSLVEQAAKTLPKMSEELLKKAAELRANELSPADIEKLRKAAEFLSRDLTQIGQSKELQKALQEMARQIRPEQIEQVARELGNQEKLKQELEAAARLLSENQQAKEMVAGLTEQFARTRDAQRSSGKPEARKGGSQSPDQALGSSRADGGGAAEKLATAADQRLAGRGREPDLKGRLRQGSGGEYLYMQSKAGVGAARAPYSSAYPQYRREAERSVQRTQVPPALRSMVRKYFDAINPDAKR